MSDVNGSTGSHGLKEHSVLNQVTNSFVPTTIEGKGEMFMGGSGMMGVSPGVSPNPSKLA